MSMSSEEERRMLFDIVDKLGHIKGAQDANRASTDKRLDSIESSIRENHSDAELSRRSLHETIQDMVGKMRVTDLRIEQLTHSMTLMAPMSAVSALTEAHDKIESAHRDIRDSVEKLEKTNVRVSGITEGVSHAAYGIGVLAKGAWAVLIVVGGFFGGTIVAVIEHYLSTGTTPPGK